MPDETQETDLLPRGEWQIEAAYLHNLYSTGGPSDIGQVLIRYGFSKRLELRFLTEAGSELHKYIENTVQSTFPAAASAKILLLKDHRCLPDITLITYLHLPFYNVEKDKKAYWSSIFLIAFNNELGKKWKLEYNAGLQQEAYSMQWAYILNAAIHYQEVDQLEIFSEYFAQYHPSDNSQHNVGAGLAYQLNNYVEVFAMAGGTVNYAESNHYINAGVAFKLP